MRLAKINGLYIIWYVRKNNLTVSVRLGTLTVFSLFIAVQFWAQKGLDGSRFPSYNHHTAEGKMLPGSILNRGVAGFDHIVDHIWLRSTRKQWRREF